MKPKPDSDERVMKLFLRKHPQMSFGILIGILVVLVVSIYVFWWVVNDAQTTGLIPVTLGAWTVAYGITFFLHLIFWELVLAGSWAIPIGALVYFGWYQKLPAKERKEYEKDSKKNGDKGGISFLASIVWLGIIWFSGLWDRPFQNWSTNEWVFTWLTAWGMVLGFLFVLGTLYLTYLVSKGFK